MNTINRNSKEIWLPIPNFDGLYEASSLGNVRAPEKRIIGRLGIPYTRPAQQIRVVISQSNGYGYVRLSKNGKSKNYRVHRIVADLFVENPNGYNVVNHKDENKANNRADNLEWCTHDYNVHYGTGISRTRAWMMENRAKPIQQYSKSGDFIREFPSVMDASKELNIEHINIIKCAKGSMDMAHNGKRYSRKTAGGYVWKYKEDHETKH